MYQRLWQPHTGEQLKVVKEGQTCCGRAHGYNVLIATIPLLATYLENLVAWARTTYLYHMNGTDTVSRSVDAHGPIDQDSVGLEPQ